MATSVAALCLVVDMAAARPISRDHKIVPSARPSAAPRALLSATTTTAAAAPAPKATPSPRRDVTLLAKTIADFGGPGTVSVAAVNLVTGASYRGGSTHGQWIGSAYKLLLVESLLLKHDGDLSDSEQSDAALAIEHSDNPAGYRLYLDLGGRPDMMQQLRRLGIKHFVPGLYDPTFSTTSAADLLQAVRVLVDLEPLGAGSRKYVLDLLSQVAPDQRWGIGAAATSGDFLSKNGWLSVDDGNPDGENDGGRWAVNSVGIVVVRGQKVLMAVMTQHNNDFAYGVRRVETLAKLVAGVVRP